MRDNKPTKLNSFVSSYIWAAWVVGIMFMWVAVIMAVRPVLTGEYRMVNTDYIR